MISTDRRRHDGPEFLVHPGQQGAERYYRIYRRGTFTRKSLDIIHPEDVSIGVGYAQKLMTGEIDFYENDRRFIHKDGSLIWVTISMSMPQGPEGQPALFIADVPGYHVPQKCPRCP